MKKVLSFVLTLAMLVSVLAGLSIVNVSAHQNYKMEPITFDEAAAVTDSNPTGYKYGTGNIDRTEGFKNIEQYFTGGKFTAFHNNKYYFNDVAEAPDKRYGKSLLIREYYEEGAATQYVQTVVDPTPLLCGTVNAKASLYTKGNENDSYIQRAVQLRSQNDGGGYTNKVAVLFAHNKNRAISAFGKDTGKTYKTDVWYDIDLTYNLDNGQFHLVIFEDGVEYINFTGTDTDAKIPNVNTMILYHSQADANSNDMWIYWDNVSIKSVNKFEIAEDNSSKEIFDYTAFPGGNPKNQPASTRGSWAYGYNNASKKSVADSFNDPEQGEVLKWFGPVWDEETAFESADKTLKDYYNYPRMTYTIADSHFTNDLVQISMKLKTNQAGELAALYLNSQGSVGYSPLMLYGNTFKICNTDTGVAYERGVWYDVNIIIDTATGYFNGSVIHPTDKEKNACASGYNPTMKLDITSLMFRMDRLSKAATMANECAVFIDDLYLGAPFDTELSKVELANVTAAATAEEAATQTLYFPYAKSYAGHDFKATLTIEGAAPTVTVGDVAIDVSALEPGSYPLNVVMMTGDAPEVKVTLNGEEVEAEFASIPTAVTLTTPVGEGNLVSVSDIYYSIIYDFEITNEINKDAYNPLDDVVIEFSNKLSNPSADSFKVYKPEGSIDEKCEITEKTVTFGEDGHSATISFEKEDLTHYHIALEGLTDIYGNTLTDAVEFTTKLPDLVITRPSFWRMNDGKKEVLSLLTPGEVNASVTATAYNNTDFEMLFAMAMYNKGDLVKVVITSGLVSAEGVTLDRSITVPDDGKFYEIKAFALRKDNMKPLVKTEILNFTTDQPIAIIKLDDYGQSAHQACWDSIVEYAEANNFKMCIGLMGYTLNNNPDQQKAAARIANSPMIEMWCHAYNWQNDRLTSDDPEVQAVEFAESNRVAKEAGFEMTSFCAPSNALNELTLQVMTERFPNYNLIMTRENIYKAYAEKYPQLFFMWRGVTVESKATGTTDAVEDIKARWNAEKAKGAPYLMLQAHPSGWDTNTDSRDRFYEFINWLKDQGVVFMTPAEYLEYSKS